MRLTTHAGNGRPAVKKARHGKAFLTLRRWAAAGIGALSFGGTYREKSLMKNLPACLLMAGLLAIGCKDSNNTPNPPSGGTTPSGETKGDPKEILAALRQLGAAFHKFEEKHGHLPAAPIRSKDGKPLLSWRVA